MNRQHMPNPRRSSSQKQLRNRYSFLRSLRLIILTKRRLNLAIRHSAFGRAAD
jgi:hypothetical protein